MSNDGLGSKRDSMNILMVKSTIPFVRRAGTDVISANIMKILSLDNCVTFLGLAHSKSELEQIKSFQGKGAPEIHAVLAPNKRSFVHRIFYKLLNAMKLIFLLRSLEVSYNTPASLKRALSRLTKANRYDLVIIEYWRCASLKKHVKGGAKVALLIHDAAFINDLRRLHTEKSLLRKTGMSLYYRFKKWEELRSISRFDSIFALSSADVQHIQGEGKGLESLSFQTLPLPFIEGDHLDTRLHRSTSLENSLYFIGSLDRFNNFDAVFYFLEEIYPHLRSSVKDVKVFLVGSCPPVVRKKLEKYEPVRLMGFLEDQDKELTRYRICIAPLRIGSGIKIKILEAFVLGKPVVTTSVGAEGISYYDDHTHGLCDQPENFAREIERLLTDEEYYKHVQESQRHYVDENLTFPVCRERMNRVIHRILHRSER